MMPDEQPYVPDWMKSAGLAPDIPDGDSGAFDSAGYAQQEQDDPMNAASTFFSGFDQSSQNLQLQPETPQEFLQRWQSAMQDDPSPTQQIVPDEQWDYKTAITDKMGNPLPKGAVGFDPYGRAYYGAGLQGWLNGAWSRINDPGAKEAKFDFTKENKDLATTVSNIANNVEQAGNLTDSFGATSPLTPVLRTMKEGVNGAFTALSLPAQWLEQVGGSLGLLATGEAQNIDEAWQASRITYSSWLDQSRRTQFIERMREGENPDFLAMELENPVAELVGQLVLDPLNVVGFVSKGKQAASVLEKTSAKLYRTGAMKSDETARLIESLSGADKLVNDVQAAGKLSEIGDSLTDAVKAIKTGEQTYQPGVFSRLTSAQQAWNKEVTSQHAGWLIGTLKTLGKNADEVGDSLYHTAMLASDDEGQRAVALAYALKHHPVPAMALSEEGLQMSSTLWKTIGDDADGFLNGLQKAATENGTKGVIEFASERLGAASKDMYPSVTEMREASELAAKGQKLTPKAERLRAQYDTLSNGVKAAEKFASAALPKKYKAIQGTMTGIYLANPGTVIRNLFGNLVHGFVDQGKRFVQGRDGKLFTPFGSGAKEDLARWAGFDIEAPKLGQAGAAAEGGYFGFISKAQDKVEQGASYMVMRASMQDSMEKLLQPGKFLPDVQPLLDAGLNPEQASMLTRYIVDAQGDVDKALARFKGAAKNGQIDAWRDTSALSPKLRDFAGKFGFLDDITERMSGGQFSSVDEAVQEVVGRFRDVVEHHASGTADDIIDVDPKAASYETAQELAAAVNDGHLDANEVSRWSAMVQQGHILTNYLAEAGNQIALAADWSQASAKAVSDIFRKFPDAAADVAKATRTLTDQAWEVTKLRDRGQLTDLAAAWAKYMPSGVKPPANMTPDQFVDAMWKYKYSETDKLWRSNFANLKARADQLLSQLTPGITDPQRKAHVDAIVKHYNELFDEYEQISKSVYDGKHLLPRSSSDANAAISKAEQGAMDALTKSDSTLTRAVLTAKENGVNVYQLQNHFKKTGEPMTAESVAAYVKSQLGEGVEPKEIQALSVPAVAEKTPSSARVARISQKGMEPELQALEQFIRDNWDKTIGTFGVDADSALNAYSQSAKVSVAEARKIALNVANNARDFALLPYTTGKTGLDAALSYVYPLGFWPTRTYANWGKRAITDPQVLAAYAKYRNTMEKVHADMPEFYRNNVNIHELLGIQTDNPMFFNLEASLWPLNGITGVDFNDPYKRVDWWTSTLDDMANLGPGGISTNITALTAIALYMRGEKEASARWAGRLVPQTAQIKAALSLGSVVIPDSPFTVDGHLRDTPFTRGNELDPFVNFFSGGDDPYERRRYGTALQKMVDEGKITPEQALDAAQSQSGDVWEQAKKTATDARALPTLASWGLGVGWKGRTATDLRIEKFYSEFNAMNKKINGGALSADATRLEFDRLREKYPFMDLVILSKKDGPDRDRAYAYNTLGRIPPGQSGDLAEAAGISDELIQQFYDSKGKMTGWAESDKQKFMAGITDLAAVLAIPDDATSDDWEAARVENFKLREGMKQVFAPDILDKIDAFYAIGNETQRQQDLRDNYLKMHPEVEQAMNARSQTLAQNPILNSYYGGISAIEKFYTGKMYESIKSQLGQDIFDKFSEYGDLQLTDPKAATAYYRAHPELKQYSVLKDEWQGEINRRLAQTANMLRPGMPAQMRPDIPATTGTTAIQGALQNEPQMTWDQWAQIMPEPVQRLVIEYFTDEKELTPAAEKRLARIATDYGYNDVDELLQVIGSSLYQQTQP